MIHVPGVALAAPLQPLTELVTQAPQRVAEGAGVYVSVLGMGSVFFALTVLALFMWALSWWFTREEPSAAKAPASAPAPTPAAVPQGPSPAVLAAIATAVALDLAADEAPPVQRGRTLSPWRLSGRKVLPNLKR